SRYNGITVGIKRLLDPNFQFELNYTLGFDKSDDDNERDPFTLRYAAANNLAPEYNWSDRDQRHRFNGWVLVRLPGDIRFDNRVSYYSAQPTSASCGPTAANPFAPPAGARASGPQDRVCADGSILLRNTLRKDNAYFSWDISLAKTLEVGGRNQAELIIQVFNLLNRDNFRDPSYGNLLFNFDGTIRSGLGDPRQLQAGVRWIFEEAGSEGWWRLVVGGGGQKPPPSSTILHNLHRPTSRLSVSPSHARCAASRPSRRARSTTTGNCRV